MKRFGSAVTTCLFCCTLVGAGPLPTGFTYPDFSDTTGLLRLGSAAIAGTALRLTPADPGGTGAAWFRSLQPVAAGFNTTFQFQITDLVFGGADGFAFVVQNRPPGSSQLAGAAATWATHGIPNSLAVEFDTWQNIDDPPRWGRSQRQPRQRAFQRHRPEQRSRRHVVGQHGHRPRGRSVGWAGAYGADRLPPRHAVGVHRRPCESGAQRRGRSRHPPQLGQ